MGHTGDGNNAGRGATGAWRRLRLGVALALVLTGLQGLGIVGAPTAEAAHGGVWQWVHQLGTGGWDQGRDVATDDAGNVYVTGTAYNTLPGSSDEVPGGENAFVASWTADGTPRWVHQLGNTDYDIGDDVEVDGAGNLYLAGATSGTLPGSPDTNAGGFDIFVAAWSTDGAPRWVHQLGGTDNESAGGLAMDGAGNLYAAGTTTGTIPGSPEASAGEWDAFVARMTLAAQEAPVAQDLSVTLTQGSSAPITLVASDDGLPDPPAALSFTVLTLPANGILSGTAPDLVYMPNPGHPGPDSFTYRAGDGELDSNVATVSITVLGETELFAMNAISWRKHGGWIVVPNVSVRLTDANTDLGITGREVDITVGGEHLCSATTGRHGWARCGGTIRGDAATIAGGYDAGFAGDDTYAPSDDHGTLFELRRR